MSTMKKSLVMNGLVVFLGILAILLNLISCKKTENPIKFPKGTFPDTTINLTDINSVYDDLNTDIYVLLDDVFILFSSNRGSTGGQFDLFQGLLTYVFDQTSGEFGLGCEIAQEAYLTNLINAANTDGDDLGPYTLFSTVDGYQYLLLSSASTGGDLDLNYFKNIPVAGGGLPDIQGPFPVTLLNTGADDAYISCDTNQDSVYFCSNYEGNFDIYLKQRTGETDLATWFNGAYSAPVKIDSLQSPGEDKCPFVFRKVMVFASDRPGGLGGFDLYYSEFKKGKWSSPVNFGPGFNTSYDEYRPVVGYHTDFKNNFIIFSSNRPEGKGGYDLYFRGITFPDTR